MGSVSVLGPLKVTKNLPQTNTQTHTQTWQEQRSRENETQLWKHFLATLEWKLPALLLDTSLVGKWRDTRGHGCFAVEWAARLKHKLVLCQIGSRMKLLFSLCCTTSVLSLLIVLLGPWFFIYFVLCPLSIHILLCFPLLTCLLTVMLILHMYVCVCSLFSLTSPHIHTLIVPASGLLFWICVLTQPGTMAHFIFCSDCTSPCFFTSFFTVFSHSLSPSPSSPCALFAYSFPFTVPLSSIFFTLVVSVAMITSNPVSTPHHLSRKQPEMCCFCITMRQMLTSDSKQLLVHTEQAKQNEAGSHCFEWCAYAQMLCLAMPIQTVNKVASFKEESPL